MLSHLFIFLMLHAINAACVNEFPQRLDVNMFWASIDTLHGTVVWTKSCPDMNITSRGFDPTRPTIIGIHGLQPEMVQLREQFGVDGLVDFAILPWLGRGYNFGVFLWTQFADEEIVKMNFVLAEDKIYSTHGFGKMRYKIRTPSGKIAIRDAPLDRTVTDMFLDAWRFHFPDGTDYPEVRLMGHSLGTQLTVNAAYRLYSENITAKKPERLALLDAVMSPMPKMYLEFSPCGETISENMGCHVRELNDVHGVAIEYYKTSFINRCIFSSREDKDLIRYTAFETVTSYIYGDHPLGSCWDDKLLHNMDKLAKYAADLKTQVMWQHGYSIVFYLLSINLVPHRCVLSFNATDGAPLCDAVNSPAISAAMDTADVLMWSRAISSPDGHDRKICFRQYDETSATGLPRTEATSSTMTLSPHDDLFYPLYCDHVKT